MKLPQKFKEKNDSEIGFAQYYSTNIVPLHKDIEVQRQKLFLTQSRNGPVAIILATLSSIGLIFAKIKFLPYNAIYHKNGIGKAIMGIYIWFWWALVGRYKKNYIIVAKNKLLPVLVKFFGDLSYSISGEINQERIKRHFFISEKISIHSEDHIQGSKNGINFELSEIRVTNSSNNNSSFGGFAIYLKNMPNLQSSVIAISEDVQRAMQKNLDNNGLKEVRNIEGFVNKFYVYSTNEDEARRMFDRDLCDKLLKDNIALYSSGLRFSYIEDSLLILIPCQENLLEIDLDYPAQSEMGVRNLIKELNVAMEAVEFFSKKFEHFRNLQSL